MPCDACPLRGTATPCPDPAYYCPRVERDAKLPPKARFWADRLVHLAGQPPIVRPQPARRVTLRSSDLVIRGHGNSTGYGRMAAYLARALHQLGQPVAFDSIEGDRPGLDPFLRDRLAPDEFANPCVQMSSPWAFHRPGMALFSMYEASRLPAESVEKYNAGRVVVVPCEWNAKVFRDSGVKAPIRVIPLGIDPATYHPHGRPEPTTFTALSVNALRGGGHRKDVPGLIRAFLEALGDRDDARLILKITEGDELDDPGHPRVLIDRSHYADREMADLYRSASVYATMTKAEGFGLPIIEAMACGTPVVGPIHSGIAEFLTPGCGWPVEHGSEVARGPWYDGVGEWFPVDHRGMVEALRSAYADREAGRSRGEAAAKRASEFTWARSAAMLLAVLREFGMAREARPRPRPEVSRQARLSVLRNKCPDGSKAEGCGCSGDLLCARRGSIRVSRDQCFACLESDLALTSSSSPTGA